MLRSQLKSLSNIFAKTLKLNTVISCPPLKINFEYSSLFHKNAYRIVNIQIDSKYYHQRLPTKVSDIINMVTKQKKLNQKCVLLQHLTDVIIEDKRIVLSKDQQKAIVKQLSLWKGRKGRFQKVATVAWVIKRLNLYQYLQELYEQIAQRVSNDQWYVNFDESLKALEAFTDIQNEQLKNYIYPRIQRNLDLTVWQINMEYYKRITVGLLQNNRLQSGLWDKLQQHIMKNLSMEYSLKTITDIFISYALAQKGTDVFYQMIQKAIYLGHWYDYDYKHKILPGYDQPGQFYALLVQTYSITKKNCNIYLIPQFLDYIYNGVSDRKTNYQKLSSFTKIISNLPGLFDDENGKDVIENLLKNKIPISITYQDAIQFYNLMNMKEIAIPHKLHQNIENSILSDINRKFIPPSKALYISEYLIQHNYALHPQQFIEAIQNTIAKGFKYLEVEQMKEVLELSSKSRFLPDKTKQLICLPIYTQSSN